MNSGKFLAAVALLVPTSGCADSDQANNVAIAGGTRNVAIEAGLDVQAATLAAAADRSRLTLRGTVISPLPNSFQLDYGPDTVTVEMDDWDWYQEGRALKAGDEVVVAGRVDQDLWESKKIEASSIFVRNLGVHFYASGSDEEAPTNIVYVPSPTIFSDASGFVTAVEGREFTVGADKGPVRVDTSQVVAPLNVKIGDRVYAWGDLDIDPQEKLELMAKGVVIVTKGKTKSS